MSETVISTRRAEEVFAPPGSPRTYTLKPLRWRERQAFRAELARVGGIMPAQAQLIEGLREGLRELAPDNLAELLAVIDQAQAAPEDAGMQARLAAIEALAATLPVYADLLAARTRYLGAYPFIAARHCLRGWAGPGLPDYGTDRAGLALDRLLDEVPEEELEAVGWRASALMSPAPAAMGNFAAP